MRCRRSNSPTPNQNQLGRNRRWVEAQRRSGQRPRPVGRNSGAAIPIPDPVDVPDQRLRVGRQVVRQQNGLGVLEMCPTRHRRVGMRQRLTDQRGLQISHHQRDRAGSVAKKHPVQRRDLVVAGPTGAELSAEFLAGPVQ